MSSGQTKEAPHSPSLPAPVAAPLGLRLLMGACRLLPPVRGSGRIGNWLRRAWWARHEEPSRVRVSIGDGLEMIVDPRDNLGGELAFFPQLHDRWERKRLQGLLRAGGVFVDIGAHVGAYTLWAARRVGPAGRVVAIEADPDTAAELQRNVELNGFDERVTCVRAGVSDAAGVLPLYRQAGDNRGGTSFVKPGTEAGAAGEAGKAGAAGEAGEAGRTPAVVEVPCLPLSELLDREGVERVDVLKLDIEGFELRALQAFFASEPAGSPRRAPVLLLELNDVAFGAAYADSLLRLLEREGYALEARSRNLNGLFRLASGGPSGGSLPRVSTSS